MMGRQDETTDDANQGGRLSWCRHFGDAIDHEREKIVFLDYLTKWVEAFAQTSVCWLTVPWGAERVALRSMGKPFAGSDEGHVCSHWHEESQDLRRTWICFQDSIWWVHV